MPDENTIAPKNIVLIGPANSGKGTYSAALVEKYGIVHVSTGDLFREEIKKETKLGLKAKTYIDQGNLVPDNLTIKMLKNRISQPDAANGVVLDGFPRTLNQAETLLKNINLSVVLNVEIPDEIVVKRALNRRVCCLCGFISKIENIKDGEKCSCGGDWMQREDDNVTTVEKRIVAYRERTLPVVEFFKNVTNQQGKKIYMAIDASGDIPEVVSDIMTKLEAFFAEEKEESK